MIEEAINQAVLRDLDSIGVWLWAHTLGLVDPFWGYAIEGSLVIAATVAVSWFFPALRSFGGAVVMAAIAFLVGFWKGEAARTKKK